MKQNTRCGDGVTYRRPQMSTSDDLKSRIADPGLPAFLNLELCCDSEGMTLTQMEAVTSSNVILTAKI